MSTGLAPFQDITFQDHIFSKKIPGIKMQLLGRDLKRFTEYGSSGPRETSDVDIIFEVLDFLTGNVRKREQQND
jgi:hypothetical protein